MNTLPQGSLVWPKELIYFKGGNGRLVSLAPSQSLWVTNSQLDQQHSKIVKLARSGKNAGHAWNFSIEDAQRLFTCPQHGWPLETNL